MATIARMRQRMRRGLMQWGWRFAMAIGEMRREYDSEGLSEADAAADPLEQFRAWFDEAKQADILDPNAMTLATCGADGVPEARIVLLKSFDEQGFAFYTNYRSDKAAQLKDNPRASLMFYWDKLNRTVRLVGDVTRVPRDMSERYFSGRPRASQIAAWISEQSRPIADRDALEARFDECEKKFEGRDVPAPPFWGGFRLRPQTYEFWQGQPSRMHDRLRYDKQPDGSWQRVRLCP